jgi:hypothetical protein
MSAFEENTAETKKLPKKKIQTCKIQDAKILARWLLGTFCKHKCIKLNITATIRPFHR